MEKWFEIRKGGDFRAIGAKYGIDPLAARVMRNRGVATEEQARKYLYGSLQDLEDPRGLTGIERAAEILAEKIRGKKTIRIIGDYDIDGICATFILMKGLKSLGGNVSYDIPERLADGYGLNVRLVREAVGVGIDTLVTVDNGISAASQIRLAKDAGMTVIVTDHHEPPYEENSSGRVFHIPEADAVVDPSLYGCPYPNKALCGAGVAWKLLYIMESSMLLAHGDPASARTSPASAESGLLPVDHCPLTMSLLPFAAFATVGDVMDLTGENRILVKYGLNMLTDTDNPGMQALIDAAGMKGRRLQAYHIGFVLGPCINASGRLETAHEAEELFLTDSPARAHDLAMHLTGLNQERRSLTDQGLKAAAARLDEPAGDEDLPEKLQTERRKIGDDKVLVLYLPGTHESIVGIIAGKVRERTGKPAFVLTDAQEEGELKGSGRSIPEYSMYDELVKCSDLLDKFGGHPMAAGLSLKKYNLDLFRKKINEVSDLTDDDVAKKVSLDSRLPLSYISEKLIGDLQLLEPFGKGNEKPLFGETDLALDSCRVLGARGNAVKMSVSSKNVRMTAIYFGDSREFLDRLRRKAGDEEVRKLMSGKKNDIRIMAAFYPEVNEYRGNRELQIHITNFR